MPAPDTSPKPDAQIEDSVSSIAALHDAHVSKIGFIQKLANRATSLLGRPQAVVAALVLILLWIGGNMLAPTLGLTAIDPAPFAHLELFATVCALLVTLLILTTQRHEQDLEGRRDQLTLQMALLTEKKVGKVIALLEEQRRDNPLLADRDDEEAATMSQPTDPEISLERIEDTSLTN